MESKFHKLIMAEHNSKIERCLGYSRSGVLIVGSEAKLGELANECNKILKKRRNVHTHDKQTIFAVVKSIKESMDQDKIDKNALYQKVTEKLKGMGIKIEYSECLSLHVLPLKKKLEDELKQLEKEILTQEMIFTLKETFPENEEDGGGIIDRNNYKFDKLGQSGLVKYLPGKYIDEHKTLSFERPSFLVSIQPLVYFAALADYNSTDVNLFGGAKSENENSLQVAIRELEEEAAIKISIEDKELLCTIEDPPIEIPNKDVERKKVCYILNVTNLKFKVEDDHVKVTKLT